jgi:hypothetical protein
VQRTDVTGLVDELSVDISRSRTVARIPLRLARRITLTPFALAYAAPVR